MKQRWLTATLALFLLPAILRAQDARGPAIGGAATAAPMELFGLYWNPALLANPIGSGAVWSVGSGFSAFDSSNAGSPILQFNSRNASQSSQDPVQRSQQYLGLFGVRYAGMAGGMIYDQKLSYLSSQGALAFFRDRDAGSLSLTNPYALNYQQTTQQISNVILSYSTPLPIGNVQLLSVGGSLKYHVGLQYQQILLTGTYQSGSATGYQYTKVSSNSGLGYSVDGGFFAKITDSLQLGMMFQNLQSSFSWQAQQQNLSLSPTTGAETVTSTSNINVTAPFPYAAKLGLVLAPPEKNTLLEGEVSWSQQQTHWRFGMEQYNPDTFFAVRFGTFFDNVSNSQLWAFGLGYDKANLNIDISLTTRSLPDVTGSIALGGALDVMVRF